MFSAAIGLSTSDTTLIKFRRWLVQEEINQKLTDSKKVKLEIISFPSSNRIEWIEKLLETPLEDHRKYCLLHILVPYLLNVRKLSVQESSITLEIWLLKCRELTDLDFNPSIEIKNKIKYVKDYKPLGLKKLSNQNPELYFDFKSKNIL